MSVSKPSDGPRHRVPVREAILISVQVPGTSDTDVARSLGELEHLLRGLGIGVISEFVQKREARTFPAYVGEGKARSAPQRRPRGRCSTRWTASPPKSVRR